MQSLNVLPFVRAHSRAGWAVLLFFPEMPLHVEPNETPFTEEQGDNGRFRSVFWSLVCEFSLRYRDDSKLVEVDEEESLVL